MPKIPDEEVCESCGHLSQDHDKISGCWYGKTTDGYYPQKTCGCKRFK
mgnify:CR=1 FL=1